MLKAQVSSIYLFIFYLQPFLRVCCNARHFQSLWIRGIKIFIQVANYYPCERKIVSAGPQQTTKRHPEKFTWRKDLRLCPWSSLDGFLDHAETCDTQTQYDQIAGCIWTSLLSRVKLFWLGFMQMMDGSFQSDDTPCRRSVCSPKRFRWIKGHSVDFFCDQKKMSMLTN